ncbi:uncharacterized protein YcgI (DUF1989 family) [Croceicoccus sp. BE223]|nr:uncharacterized protein YcgI (DUF1989 family) [Croceicoccus sp. BE223]
MLKGQALTVIDAEGTQVADLIAFALHDPSEMLSNGRTFDYEETTRLTTGNRLWSGQSNAMLVIERDTVGVHDFLLTPCSKETFRHFYPDKPVHHGCFGNLRNALIPWGIRLNPMHVAFNCFMNVPADATGRLSVDPPVSRPGDSIVLRAEMDLVIGLTACSAYASNGGSFKPIDYEMA